MSKRGNGNFALRLWVTAVCLALPTLTLAPFGGIWLFQHGYALYWVAGACLFVVIAFLFQLYLLPARYLAKGLAPRGASRGPGRLNLDASRAAGVERGAGCRGQGGP